MMGAHSLSLHPDLKQSGLNLLVAHFYAQDNSFTCQRSASSDNIKVSKRASGQSSVSQVT